ncbi:hypothetical protein C5167_005081 [Papaver somniferum]|uniref:peptidylprolyl isomerase n=1 Tax=Papaver somniferum TaxID=3469 RepID=A0A4Y7JDA9_PAPSO|nr:peptidyl-prolyl cis-trans isomerase FKBP53-like [Papaver somniferum]RZC57778.1 hypothetical protein C5167_005081 [Papaver somniferum]
MAFWGTELLAGEPVTHVFKKSQGRLRICKATLGVGLAEGRSVVQCKIGDKSPILLCSLRPYNNETCSVDIEFKEEEKVIFEAIGPTTTSVHLAGFYLTNNADGQSDSNEVKKAEDDEAGVNGRVKTFPSGLIIEDLEKSQHSSTMIASPGSMVSVSYVGKLKFTGYIFESRNSSSPFYFRLGTDAVIAGLEIGITGMRVGDKRKITIPPSMAYGPQGRKNVPPESWVEYTIKLLSMSNSVPPLFSDEQGSNVEVD